MATEMSEEIRKLGPITPDGEINWEWVGSKGMTLQEWYDKTTPKGERTEQQQKLDDDQFYWAVATGLII